MVAASPRPRMAIVTPPLPDGAISPMANLGPAVLRGDLEARGYALDTLDLCGAVRFENRRRVGRRFPLDPFYANPDRLRAHLDGDHDDAIAAATEALLREGRLDRYDVVGFSLCLDTALGPALCLARRLKESARPPLIVLGGPIFERSDFGYLLELDAVDAIVKGDGEPAMRALAEGRPLEGIEGVETRGRLARPASVPLDEKACPVFEGVDVERYRRLGLKGRRWLPYLLTRGCRYRCSFCRDYTNVRFTYTPTEKVLDDLSRLRRDHAVDSIYFGESNINNDPDAIAALSEGLIRRELGVAWGGLGTISGLDPELIPLMARAGCRFLSIGVETASERLREKWNIGKCRDLGEIRRRLELLHAHGIRVNALFIVSFPHETREDHVDTMRFLGEVAGYLTTVGASEFDLVEGSPAHMRQGVFGLSARPRPATGRYAFLDRYAAFDEIGGLGWEAKQRQARVRLTRFEQAARLRVGLPLALRLWREDPLYPLRRLVRRPYFDYDVYL